jgi:hypothetical protein
MKGFICNAVKFLTFGIICFGWCETKGNDEKNTRI